MDVEYRVRENMPQGLLTELFRISWDPPATPPPIEHSLSWITARANGALVGFVNVAWDGRTHAFLLDPTVDPKWRHKGIGTALVRKAVEEAHRAGVRWMHVDYEPQLAGFYEGCGFRPTSAGVIDLG
jgi:GNAT superfamily N-acetyltransferase